jgi:hypothetical protein
VRYYARVALGAVLGLAAVGVLWFLGVRWWIGAIAGALLGGMGFLGSFFLWSADRPSEGYEQVLFDGRNNAHALLLLVVLVGASFGGSYLHRAPAAAPGPDAAALAAMDAGHDNMTRIYNAIQSGNYTSAAAAADAGAQVQAIQAALSAMPASAKGDLLKTAANALQTALDEFKGCSDAAGCGLAGRLAKADAIGAKTPLNQYAV